MAGGLATVNLVFGLAVAGLVPRRYGDAAAARYETVAAARAFHLKRDKRGRDSPGDPQEVRIWPLERPKSFILATRQTRLPGPVQKGADERRGHRVVQGQVPDQEPEVERAEQLVQGDLDVDVGP
ncbi:hypothetical protein FrEUN1fDRAFT_7343 [Parafrankia sp. EUN1f]|nr:hypothetical protein FrEUN1fDRAFT_7343 [Parafrankia sp. EUN1f]